MSMAGVEAPVALCGSCLLPHLILFFLEIKIAPKKPNADIMVAIATYISAVTVVTLTVTFSPIFEFDY